MDEATRIKICGLIAGMLSSDREIHEEEAAFLQRMRVRFELPKGTAIDPATDPDAAVAALRALPAESREQALDLIIEAAAVDGSVSDAERGLLGAVAAVAGVSPEALEERVQAQLAARKPQPFGLAAKQEDDL